MSSILPASLQEGYLPFFMLYTCIAGIGHTAWCYLNPPSSALRMFSGPQAPPPTTLAAHIYAVKNFYTCAMRLYAVYNLNNRPVYNLAMLSYAGVIWLYLTEYAVWKTAQGKDAAVALTTSGIGLAWMVLQRGWYLR
ncbi:hypothetical protein VTJ49DRAFT_6817 [Mycothermus thermophilus]|uniref:Uncharacterized protein n=1 Tax=Humicola insolens TaxID=85995 RepID=A0ABR3V0T6_HUMIN